MRIQIAYFASLREKAGLAGEIIHTSAKTPLDLFHELKEKYDFPLDENIVRVAVNHRFQGMDFLLKESDLVVFVPPVAGG